MTNQLPRVHEMEHHAADWATTRPVVAGTQGVVAATGASAIVLGSFVIAAATVRYLREANEVTIVAMGQNAQEDADEDLLCARYLAAALRGDPLPSIEVTLVEAWPDWFPRRDAELALEVDRFAFALPVHRENGLLIARADYV